MDDSPPSKANSRKSRRNRWPVNSAGPSNIVNFPAHSERSNDSTSNSDEIIDAIINGLNHTGSDISMPGQKEGPSPQLGKPIHGQTQFEIMQSAHGQIDLIKEMIGKLRYYLIETKRRLN